MSLGPLEIGIIVLLILVLFGYKKLPAASRSLGQSLRIFKGEMKGMKSDDAGKDATPVRPAPELPARPAPSGDLTAQLQDEARADRSGTVDGSR
jgi:sec-independent protein translocase protein TatA